VGEKWPSKHEAINCEFKGRGEGEARFVRRHCRDSASCHVGTAAYDDDWLGAGVGQVAHERARLATGRLGVVTALARENDIACGDAICEAERLSNDLDAL